MGVAVTFPYASRRDMTTDAESLASVEWTSGDERNRIVVKFTKGGYVPIHGLSGDEGVLLLASVKSTDACNK